MNIANKRLKKRILDISYKLKLSHIGSCMGAVDILEDIYKKKHDEDIVVLSAGHAALALYVVIEKHGGRNAEDIFNHHGVHPDRCSECNIAVSSGSLGLGLPIAVGMALADRSRTVYCVISDGECSEGSIWEALRIQREQYLENLHVFVHVNGWGAYKNINTQKLANELEYMSWAKVKDSFNYFHFMEGQDAHYHVLTEDDYKKGLKILHE